MAKLQYPAIIETDKKFTALADLGKRLNSLDKSQIMTHFVDLVSTAMLPLLAEKWSVTGDDGWLLAETEDAKRNLIKRAVEIHRYKGTPWAIREIFRQLGFGDIDIIENQSLKTWDGELTFEGLETFEHEDMHWAEYKIRLKSPITHDEAERIRRILKNTAPARCHLVSFEFDEVAFRWDGDITFDGNYTFGEVE